MTRTTSSASTTTSRQRTPPTAPDLGAHGELGICWAAFCQPCAEVAQSPALEPGVVPCSRDAGERTERPVKHSRDHSVDQFKLSGIVQLQGGQNVGCDVGLLLNCQVAYVELFPQRFDAVRTSQIGEEKPATRSQHPAHLGEKSVHGLITMGGLDVDDGVEGRGKERHCLGVATHE